MMVALTQKGSLCGFLLVALISLPTWSVAEELIQKRGPIKIVSDRLEADDGAQTLVFSGNAVATQDEVTIYGDRMTVKYVGDERDVEQVIADGSVRIVRAGQVATSDKAIYFRHDGRVVLSGSPRVSDGSNFIEGAEITLFLDDQRSVITGGEDGRVNAVFTPPGERKP